MKNKVIFILFAIFISFPLKSQTLDKEVFTLLNPDFKGLERVNKLHEAGKEKEAAEALLEYFKNRTSVINPEVKLERISISKEEQQYVDDAMEHKFFSHEGFKPSFFYGKDIDWNYWPVHDNELRWQLHRLKWFIPMGKAFRLTGDEKYAKEWVFQYLDWIKKNPIIEKKKDIAPKLTKAQALIEDNKVDDDNMRYAWRPLEVSARLQNQYAFFQYFNISKNFTPEFFSNFLVNTNRHANYILNNYTEDGNHLLFEAQRVLYAGILFPEFKDAPIWRKSGIDTLNSQMGIQVYPDGMQYELDPMYHLAMINVFCKALQMADMNGYRAEFSQKYKDGIEKMISAYYYLLLPDLSIPMFSDTHEMKASDVLKNSKEWAILFPSNQQIRYFATKGKEGTPPQSRSKALKTSGFYSLRSSWDIDATAMILKGGPAGEWHCQLDNGTFNLMVKGRNFFPDAGSFSYAGDEEVMKLRNWFRQTKVHNTLTLNNANLDTAETKCLFWKTDEPTEILVTENPSYKDLKHRRSVFFVEKKFFVIVDEAAGTATGKVGIHYQMCEGDVSLDLAGQKAFTNFSDGNNLILKTFAGQNQNMSEEEGWVSYQSKKKSARKAFAFNSEKITDPAVRFITVILPVENAQKAPDIKASFDSPSFNEKGLKISVNIGNRNYKLNYQL